MCCSRKCSSHRALHDGVSNHAFSLWFSWEFGERHFSIFVCSTKKKNCFSSFATPCVIQKNNRRIELYTMVYLTQKFWGAASRPLKWLGHVIFLCPTPTFLSSLQTNSTVLNPNLGFIFGCWVDISEIIVQKGQKIFPIGIFTCQNMF